MASIFRFCVGTKQGPRSTVWKLFSHADEMYLQSRGMGTTSKISFHRTGQAHWARTDKWVVATGARNQNRYLTKWTYEPPQPHSPTHAVSIVFPASELQTPGAPRRLATIRWLEAPPAKMALVVERFIGIRPFALAGEHRPGLQPIGAFPMGKDRVVALYSHIDAFDLPKPPFSVASQSMIGSSGLGDYGGIHHLMRGIVLFHGESSSPMLVEFNPEISAA